MQYCVMNFESNIRGDKRAMIPKNIDRNHVILAIQEIDEKSVPKSRKSAKFQLLYNGNFYPPKYIISVANKYANGKELEPFE